MTEEDPGPKEAKSPWRQPVAVFGVYLLAMAGFVSLLVAAAIAKGEASAFRYVGF